MVLRQVTREQLAASAMAYVEAGEVQGACVICVELQLQDWIPAEVQPASHLGSSLFGGSGLVKRCSSLYCWVIRVESLNGLHCEASCAVMPRLRRYGKLCPVVQPVLVQMLMETSNDGGKRASKLVCTNPGGMADTDWMYRRRRVDLGCKIVACQD